MGAYRDRALDVVQDVLLKIIGGQTTYRDKSWSYVERMLANRCKDEFRQITKERRYCGRGDITSRTGKHTCEESTLIVEDTEDAEKWCACCDLVLENARFLEPCEISEPFRVALKGEALDTGVVKKLDGRINLKPERRLDFLRTEVRKIYDSEPSHVPGIEQYCREVARVVSGSGHWSTPDSDTVELLVGAHMVTSPWPGWPLTPWTALLRKPKPEPLLRRLVSGLQECRIIRGPEPLRTF